MATKGSDVLQYLFDRPTEFIFMPKGENNSIVFDVPDQFVKIRYRGVKCDIIKKFSKDTTKNIAVKNISLPDLTEVQKLGLKENFTLFIPKHAKIAEILVEIFMKQRTVEDLISVATYCHDRVNPYLFNYALSVAFLHRSDTKNVQLPNFFQCFPGKFLDSTAFSTARKEAVAVPKAVRQPIVLARDFTATSKEAEQAVAYFREDIGVNLHHWHWHLVYPFSSVRPEIVAKDRRGELFYYMHHQILARYNTERFANNLEKVKIYENLRESIHEGYFPKLEMVIASRTWPPRFINTPLSDVDRPVDSLVVKISEVELWIKNIKEAIAKGFAVDKDGKQIPLTNEKGIDILGDMIEASSLSINPKLYGDFHNMGHVIISLAHDPDNRFLESFAVMGDTATAMRDPVFFRWHSFVNNLFLIHKDTLPKYTVEQLLYKNISVTDVSVVMPNKPPNQLITFWEQSDVDMSRGLDFAPRSPVYVRFTHLQHENFDFVVNINNSSNQQLLGTVRLFMAPKTNQKGVALTYNEQRYMMIELDRFKVTLIPGKNYIRRRSLDSSVTIPYERTFRDIDTYRPAGDDTNPALYAFNFCGCGWPQHMFIPRGTAKGMAFDLFAMVSDYNKDKVDQDISGVCNDADSYCGIQDKKYPDMQSMGYPFDRVGRNGVNKLSDFLTPNMKVQEITVKYEDRTVVKELAKGSTYSVVPPST